jgi:hypothetical protein
MTRDDPPLRIRLPEALKAEIQELAAQNHRSMNAEIVARLEWSLQRLDAPSTTTGDSVEIASIRTGLRAEENERSALSQRVQRLEQFVDDHEIRIRRLEAK